MNLAVYLDRHGGTPFAQAIDLPLSYLRAYFSTQAHSDAVKADEARVKNFDAVVGRLDSIIRGLGVVAKAAAARPSGR